jgi:plastocyanin domain-containing protein
MDLAQMLVTAGGMAAMVAVLWYFFLSQRQRVTATVGVSGAQEIRILVKGGYEPDVILVEKGRPVRLNFYRDETAACSDTVVFGDFGIARPLPAFQTTTVEFTPDRAGEFTFTCGMNMMRGRLIVEERDGR